MTDNELLDQARPTLEALRSAGFAVAVFTPEEADELRQELEAHVDKRTENLSPEEDEELRQYLTESMRFWRKHTNQHRK